MEITKTVGFVGLGAMGAPMAARILGAGFDLLAYDIDPIRMQAFGSKFGHQRCVDLMTMANRSEVVCMILPNSQVVESVLFGSHGMAGHLRSGSLVIDMTSGVAGHTRRMHARLKQQGIDLIDAPVSGAVARAELGTLAIMTGGPQEIVERAKPVLQTMGTIYPTGKIGTGHAMKALNNLVSCAGFLIGIEALLIGCRQGLDPTTMVEILSVSTGTNNSVEKKFRQYVLSRKFDSGFPLHMMLKDIENALQLADEHNVPAPYARLCLQLWRMGRNMLGPNVDHTAIAMAQERLAGFVISQDDIPQEPRR